MKLPPSHQGSPMHTEWFARVNQLESEGLDRSDAQGIADMEAEQNMKETIKTKSNMSNIKDIIKARQDLETAKENAKMAEEAATREAEETAMKPFIDVYEELKDLPLRSASGYSVRKEKLSDICSRSSCASRIELYTGHGNQFRVSSDLHQGRIRFYVEHNKHNSGWLDFDEAFSAYLDTLARLVKVD